MVAKKPAHTVDALFAKSTPNVRATYDAILKASRTLGRVVVEPKKTSIHLVRSSAFAGIATRKDTLILTVKAAAAIRSPRVHRAERTSANRWHVEVRLASPAEVDGEVRMWLREAYELAA
jgi:hypothetical protein